VWVKELDYQAQEARRGEESTGGAAQFSLYGKEKFAALATAPGYAEFLLPGRRKYSFLSKRYTCTRKFFHSTSQKEQKEQTWTRSIDRDSGRQKTVSSSHDNKGGGAPQL